VSADAVTSSKKTDEFRDFDARTHPGVRELYTRNHADQTVAFVLGKKAEYLPLRRRRMGVWDAMEALSAFVDASDPDLDLPQIEHSLQTAEWAVVGDTFPVGCAFSDRIVWPELFEANPDTRVPEYSARLGIYTEACGLDQVHLSWGHDEYLFHVLRDHLPEESLYVLRYHSFYAQHRERAYDFLLDAKDRRLMEVVREFNPHDLYSKSETRPDVAELRPYYEDLVAKFLPSTLIW
jgi:inositol oxygenase